MIKFNVGIYIDKNVKENWGGGYYYQKIILDELSKKQGENDIFFKIITNMKGYDHESLDAFLIDEKNEQKIIKKLKKNNIHLLYYIQPHIGLTSNFPFIITNWDMCHVTCPGFPEVITTLDKRKDWIDEYFIKAMAILAESKTGKDEIVEFSNVSSDKVYVVPLINSNLINHRISENEIDNVINRLDLKDQKFIFYPANFWSLKNHYNLLLGYDHAVKNGLKDCKLVLTGSDKHNMTYIRSLIHEMSYKDRIIMTGFVKEEVIYALYKKALAMIFPTFLGPTNMPILDAMFIGCPILCSNLKGHKEMLPNYDGFFDQYDYKDISKSILRLYNDIDHQKRLKNKLVKISKTTEFRTENSIKKIFQALQKVKAKRMCWVMSQ